MKVQCISNSTNGLPQKLIEAENYKIDSEFYVKVNKKYTVYGMSQASNNIWYGVSLYNTDDYAVWYPSQLFSIIDSRVSKYWTFSIKEFPLFKRVIWAFPEWADEMSYYDKLVDGEEEEVEIFKKYKLLMDLEFPDPDVSEKATALEDGWVMCPICIDAWQPHSYSGMIVCPKCNHTMHNPYYIDFHAISDR
ncbi:MAG: hypothetical protein BGO14_01245 [Chlamydiales bacterium 38-26]|nr:hypothetical protein [Chlamydiales bacterium]OJV10073.1 MAG: hypothetical protein BGO14_01245 [Chlamydiales bacterium 38-26]